MKIFSPILKGTTTVAQGTTNLSGSFTGSLLGTAATASYADNFTVGGTLTAQTINVQIITSSIEFITGSTRNGSLSTNTHQFTGSVLVSGNVTVSSAATFSSSVTASGDILANGSSIFTKAASGGYQISLNAQAETQKIRFDNLTGAAYGILAFEAGNGSGGFIERMRITSAGNVGIGTTTPASRLNVAGAKTNSADLSNGANQLAVTDTTATAIGVGGRISFLGSYTATPDYITFGAVEVLKDNANNYGSAGWNNAAMRFIVGNNDNDANAGRMLERMRITSGGNVGIGTTTPDQLLSLRKTSAGAETIALALQNIGSTTSTAVSMVFCPHENTSTPEPLAKISAIRMAASGAPTDLAFYTFITPGGLIERMRIKSEGELCVGTNTPSYNTTNRGNITINGSSTSILAFQVGGYAKAYAYHDGTNYSIVNNASGTIYMSSNGGGVQLTSGATSWASSSDERLKNINSNIENALLKLASLRTVNFSWKSDITNKEVLGLIAQDVEQVLPQVIDKNKLPIDINGEQIDETDYLSVRYTELIPVLVKAIQELSAKNTLLEERLTALENN